jgi:hypothetical protein
MAKKPRTFFEELIVAMSVVDREALAQMVHPEFEGFFPQSGELTRGFDQFMAGLEQYPGGPPESDDVPEMDLLNEEDRWAITPAYTVVPLANPEMFTIVGKSMYPDGLLWHIVMRVQLRDERLYRTETYFAPPIPAPLLESVLSGSAGTQ